MALFVKKSEIGMSAPLYTIAGQDTWLIVGLGNIGKDYDGTRHNIGFSVIDAIASKLNATWQNKSSLKASVARAQQGSNHIILAKPSTLMNNSGQAIRLINDFYKTDVNHIIVVHDELDVPFGTIRTRKGGGSAGHNGIKSASQHINPEYIRLRVGIGPKTPEQIDAADFVLAKFSKDEQQNLPVIIQECTLIIQEVLTGGFYPTSINALL